MKAKLPNLMLTTALVCLTACATNIETNKPDANHITRSNSRTGDYMFEAPAYNYKGNEVAEDFVGQINYARINLAKYKSEAAMKNIDEARDLMEEMEYITATSMPTGRVTYKSTSQYKRHYFPISAGPMEVKKVMHGPAWAKNDMAVTDADIVYLTVDTRGDKAAMRLNAAEDEIEAGNLTAADEQLALLTNEVIKIDTVIPAAVTQARDDISLARDFALSGNSSGAHFALRHADKAFAEMLANPRYQAYYSKIKQMRAEISAAQNKQYLGKKTAARMQVWLLIIKDWPEGE